MEAEHWILETIEDHVCVDIEGMYHDNPCAGVRELSEEAAREAAKAIAKRLEEEINKIRGQDMDYYGNLHTQIAVMAGLLTRVANDEELEGDDGIIYDHYGFLRCIYCDFYTKHLVEEVPVKVKHDDNCLILQARQVLSCLPEVLWHEVWDADEDGEVIELYGLIEKGERAMVTVTALGEKDARRRTS